MRRPVALLPWCVLFRWALLWSALGIVGCQPPQQAAAPAAPAPPVAAVVPVELEKHGHVRTDNYYWLRERDNPQVMAYLEAENAYTDIMMAHTVDLQERLFEEIKGRIKQTDESVPYKEHGYFYYTRFLDGKEYPLYCRKQGSLEAPEEIMIDANELAEGYPFFSLRAEAVSSGNDILAYAYDTVGRRFYTLRFKDLSTGALLPDTIANVTGNVVWANDNRTAFYAKQDPETLRSFQIWKHVLGTDPAQDELVYEEPDDTFRVRVMKSKSRELLLIASTHTLSSEYRYLDADDPDGAWQLLQPRERDLEYHVEPYGEKLYIRTNLDAPNFRLMETPLSTPTKENWSNVIPHRQEVFLVGFDVFKRHLVVQERIDGLTEVHIVRWDGSGQHYLDFGEPAYAASLSINPDFDTVLVRYTYSSLRTPDSTYDYDMETRTKVLLKRDEVLGGYDPENYVTDRLWALARDGTKVPISLVYRKGLERDGRYPLLLYGYGSYGASMPASFNAANVSLLDRGFVYAIAHVRGGQELGRPWYEDGKLLKKKNTFTDFIDCAKYLVAQGYTSPERLFAMGGSAGGLLMGAVANMEGELFKGIIARVPWVDVVTTMLDESIPLTTSEYDEWGNPNDESYYNYMLSYSPYDQVQAKDYPNMLVTTALHDSQVQYFEPAKWVAKLRACKTDNNVLLLRTNMEAGHGGPSGRYQQYREAAFIYAFTLDLVGIRW
ncbi:MAG: S9 family peptidase [Planctomycetota bacterium]